LLEYMASGRPVVATDVDESLPIKQSGAGIITPINPEAMAKTVQQLLDDENLARNMAKKGVEYAKRFDWDSIVKKYTLVLKRILENE